jgi:two-component sensor histidine kinase
VEIGNIVARALLPFMDGDRAQIAVSGPAVSLDSSTALLLAMTLHEFSTNAVKYGALSNGTGTVEVVWSLNQAAGERRLILEWRERGGPVVRPPTRKGFGSRMIERALSGQKGKVRFDYAPQGLSCVLEIAL